MNGNEVPTTVLPQAAAAPAIEEIHMQYNPNLTHKINGQAESFFTVLLKKKLDISEMANVIAQMAKLLHNLTERVNASVAANEGAQHVQQ